MVSSLSSSKCHRWQTRSAPKAKLRRLSTRDCDAVERINLERDLVAELVGGCRKVVIGYT
jgi:hypothetical protein